MSLYKRSGIWWYDFTIRGRRVRKSTDQTDKYLAGLVMNDEMAKARSRGVESILREAPLLEQFAKEFIQWVEDTHSLEPETKRYYKNGWRLLKDTKLAGMGMDAIQNHDCETVTFPGGPSSANTALRTLRRMYAKAKELGKFFGEPPEVKLRKEWPRSIAMSEQDAQAIAAKMKDGDAKDAFQIIRYAGPVRPGEVFSMRWEHVNFVSRCYHNPKGKTGRACRVMPIFTDAMEVITRRHLSQGSPAEGWVFPTRSKTGHIVSIAKAFTQARNAAGLPKVMVLYTARHGQATDLGSVVTTKELMDIGGWSDAATCMRYQHPDVKKLEAKLEAARTTGRVQ